MTDTATSARYRFGGSARTGVLLGLGMRQALPLVAGCVWLTLWLIAGAPLIGLAGLAAGLVVAFGRWRGVPLYDVAGPGAAVVVGPPGGMAAWGRPLADRRRPRVRRRPPASVGRTRAA